MDEIKGLTINEADYDLPNKGKGRIAVFIYTGSGDPKKVLDYAVHLYADGNGYHELIDANLDNPWMRVILSDINHMKQVKFKPSFHKMKRKL